MTVRHLVLSRRYGQGVYLYLGDLVVKVTLEYDPQSGHKVFQMQLPEEVGVVRCELVDESHQMRVS